MSGYELKAPSRKVILITVCGFVVESGRGKLYLESIHVIMRVTWGVPDEGFHLKFILGVFFDVFFVVAVWLVSWSSQIACPAPSLCHPCRSPGYLAPFLVLQLIWHSPITQALLIPPASAPSFPISMPSTTDVWLDFEYLFCIFAIIQINNYQRTTWK